ncbi:twin-arginine translocation signal domain-containing protein, partial [Cupriavidus sp. HPC(L)]
MKRRDFLKSGAALAGGLMLELGAGGVRAAGASAGASPGAPSSG